MENNRFPREISLCLSGGAARGAYHLGVIAILEDNGIKIKAISGTSIGAIIGASIASGNSAKDILEILKSKSFKKMFKLNIGKGSIFKIDRDIDVLKKLVNVEKFEELNIPLSVAVTDALDSKIIYFKSGNLIDMLFASSAISPLLKAVEYEGKLLVDGGLIDNFPVECLQEYAYPILGINLYPDDFVYSKSIFDWIKKVIFLSWQHNNWAKKEKCDFYISNCELENIRTIGFRDLDKAYALGKRDMQSYLKSF